ncbi:MAG: hypothetical protein A3C47_02950 [Omnitrophica bacterium RIFCSPHIGHO2_02_FULL_51_18]|nr:MAG: hypothetical protein A3C47_02950 [Omnitrophica bacterium RIFCSPHIGHO2_02_FULL_51_18]
MPKRILVVDDNHSQRMMIQSFLEDRGYSVITASDGEEALEKATQQKPDLVVMDVKMPVMEGDEAAMHLKSKEETRRIPIIFITALRTEKEIEENKEENIFAKPVRLELFLHKIKELTGE